MPIRGLSAAVVGFVVGFVVVSGFGGEALAFKQRFHEQITEEVLKAQDFDDDSADQAGDANWYTDVFEASSDAAHGDNNRLDEASERLRAKLTAIGDLLNACQRREALNALGQALHTAQDVFSHSNSVDNGIPVPDLLEMARGTATCSPPGFAPGGLVSGYFNLGGFLLTWPDPSGQCLGKPATMCCHLQLNKDAPDEPNGGRHGVALDRARGATDDYLALLEDDIRARFGEPQATQLIKILKRKQRTTYFVIDDTGSMGGDIAGVKAAVNSFLDDIIAGDEAPTLGLVSFKDAPFDRGITCDIEALRGQVNALFASGGGDCPEASNSAMLAALRHFPLIGSDMQLRGGRLLLATDASAGDAGLGPTVAIQAALKGVSIDAILTGDCVAETDSLLSAPALFSGNDPGGPLTLAPAATAPLAPGSDPLTSPSARTQLRALTQITGGVLFNVARVEVGQVVPTLLELSQPDTAVVFSRSLTLVAGTPAVLEVPIDGTLDVGVSFMVTATRANPLPVFTLRRPDGSAVDPGDPDVTRRSLSSVDTISISTPAAGRWQVELDGEGSFALRVFGSTPFRLNSVRLLSPGVTPPRPEQDFEPLSGQPVTGSSLVVDLRLTSAPGTVAATVRRPDGGLLQELDPLESIDGERRFRAGLTVPAETFIVEMTGTTVGGDEFVRDVTVPAQPQTVGVEASPTASTVRPGAAATIIVRILNLGVADTTYALQVLSSLGWLVTGPSSVTVAAGGSEEVSFSVEVPLDSPEDTANGVTFVAQDSADTRTRNSASVTVIAGALNQPPVCDEAVARPDTLFHPNRRLRPIIIEGVSDPDGDGITLNVDGITQDEPVCGHRDKKRRRAPDGTGVGTAMPSVRAERSSRGDGRVYEITFTASDGRDESCTGVVRVGVPRRRGKPAMDSGQRFDSTVVQAGRRGCRRDDDDHDHDDGDHDDDDDHRRGHDDDRGEHRDR